jgi:glucosylceramidase
VDRILQYFRNWAQCYVAWVTCLDDKRQPNSGCHPADPTFVIRDSEKENSFSYIPEVFLCGQVSRFVQRGACRVECNYGYRDHVTGAAFLNPDGSVVLIAVNQNDAEQYIEVQCDEQQFDAVVPPQSVVTYRWSNG